MFKILRTGFIGIRDLNQKNNQYQLIDVFSGIGCASLGFNKAGFQLAAALEIDPRRCRIYEKNLKLKPIRRDVMKITGKELLKKAGLRKGGKFCVVGCPPCQSFSKLSDTRGISALKDPRSNYVKKFAKLIIEMKPTAVVFENVQWLLQGPGRPFFDYYVKKLEKGGYRTFFESIDAADFGVPQHRNRVVAISIRSQLVDDGVEYKITKFYKTKKRKQKTVRDAIGDLKPLRVGQKDPHDALHSASNHAASVIKMIKRVPKNGGSRMDLPRRLWLKCHKKLEHGADSVYGRMWWDKPSPTMTCRCTTPACGRFTHPSQNRGITIREAARLQTIPDSFKIDEGKHNSAEMIGDAVPFVLARKIAEKLLEVLP